MAGIFYISRLVFRTRVLDHAFLFIQLILTKSKFKLYTHTICHSHAIVKRFYTDKPHYLSKSLHRTRLDSAKLVGDRKGMVRVKDTLKIKKLPNETVIKSNHLPFMICTKSYICNDNQEEWESINSISVEKLISNCLDKWRLSDACKILISSLNNEKTVEHQVILNLLEHLAFLGDVDNILKLKDILQSKRLIASLDILKCLHYAYCNSGRIVDGVAMLQHVYKQTQNPLDADIFFNLLTTKIIIHFPHRLSWITDFMDELKKSHNSFHNVQASLWSCYVQAEHFAAANKMLDQNFLLKKFLPAQVTKLVQCYMYLEFKMDSVFLWILQQPYFKQRLKTYVLDTLLLHECKLQDWEAVLDHLTYAKTHRIKLHQQTTEFFLNKFLSGFSETRLKNLTEWTQLTV